MEIRIKGLQGKNVVLQFPEGLRGQAYDIAKTLERRNHCKVLLLANPCYGACDLPGESLLSTLNADILLHLGHLPFPRTPEKIGTTRLIFLAMKIDIDLDRMFKVLLTPENIKHLGRDVGLATTPQHIHHLSEVRARLKMEGVNARGVKWGSRSITPGQVVGCSFRGAMRFKGSSILYFGTGRFHPLGLALSSHVPVYQYDPEQGKLIEYAGEKDRFLRKRFAQIAMAQTAQRFGVLVSTKAGQCRINLARNIQKVAERCGKDALLVIVDEVNPESLNYMKIDAWINTACPRIAIDDSERFTSPLLTPYEAMVALGIERWNKYRLDSFL